MQTLGGPRSEWIRSLPRSRMVFPETLDQRMKYAFWRAFTPVHPLLRRLAMPMLRLRGKAYRRQRHLFGMLAPGRSLERFVEYLVSRGYRRFHVAWEDPGQVLSMRLVSNFEWQYHLRVFHDGEVRGHYERTPECYPFKHLRKESQEARREEFMELLEGWIVPRDLS